MNLYKLDVLTVTKPVSKHWRWLEAMTSTRQNRLLPWSISSLQREKCRIYLRKGVLSTMSCSSTACGWMTGRERSHSDSNQLTDKLAVSHSSGYVIVESAIRSHKARLSSLSSSIRERNMSSCEKSRKSSSSGQSRAAEYRAAGLTARLGGVM